MTSRAGSIVKNRKQLGRGVSFDRLCSGLHFLRSTSIPIWAVLSSQLHINRSLEQLICRAVSPVSLYNEWRFSNIFQRLAVFKTPGDKMLPRFARIAATHFEMNDLPPLIAHRPDGTGHASLTQKRNSTNLSPQACEFPVVALIDRSAKPSL